MDQAGSKIDVALTFGQPHLVYGTTDGSTGALRASSARRHNATLIHIIARGGTTLQYAVMRA